VICHKRNGGPINVATKALLVVVSLSYGQRIQTGAFFCMMALAAFVVCGVTAFYTHRAAHGRTAEERSAYAIGLKAGASAGEDNFADRC
jgi:hypothetical protein